MPARTDNFQKFVKQKKGSAIKEEIKQQKKKEKKERSAAIEAHFEKKRAEREQRQQGIRPTPTPATTTKSGRPNKYPKKDAEQTEAKAAPVRAIKETKAPSKTPREERPKTVSERPSAKTDKGPKTHFRIDKTGNTTGKFTGKKGSTTANSDKKTLTAPVTTAVKASSNSVKTDASPNSSAKTLRPPQVPPKRSEQTDFKRSDKETGELMPLNKFVAHGGICSRRDAAILVREGKVTVNGTLATDPGMKVSVADTIKVNNKNIIPSKNFVYILLNKPKDYITTSDDPQGRKTVLDLVRTATTERIYPVGRLDRNTSGVLLLTNDGELAQKLSHPKHEVKKVYEVKLDRALTKGDMDKIAAGITLEDGFVAPDVIAYADSKDKSIIGVEIHSGRNRIVRRIFEHMKYDVKGLDRVMFAGLTKKDVQRGNWRFLKDKELRILKFMNQSFVKIKD
jgi:23S rRNA pseudouridine2605 synthase